MSDQASAQGDETREARRWRALASGTEDFLVELDRDFTYTYVNRTLPHLTPEQLVGQTSPFDFVPPEDLPRIKAVLQGVLDTGETGYYDVQVPMNGAWYRTQVVPIRDGEAIDGLILMTTDLSPLKRAQAELEARNSELLEHKLRLDEEVARRTAELRTAYSQLEEIAKRDAVTGLLTRREVLSRLSEEVKRARRYGSALSVLMLDLDHFKRVNDTYGHVAGDRVLAEAGRVLSQALRGSDHAGRYGGEELFAVVPETPIHGAAEAARRICATFEGLAHTSDEATFRVTCSIGVAALRPGMSAEDLVITADEALYAAKSKGRNTVVVSQDSDA